MGADNLMSVSKMDITSKIRCPKSTYPLYTCITHNKIITIIRDLCPATFDLRPVTSGLETITHSSKTVTVAAMTTNRITSLRELIHYRLF